jgi:hypothetical protein
MGSTLVQATSMTVAMLAATTDVAEAGRPLASCGSSAVVIQAACRAHAAWIRAIDLRGAIAGIGLAPDLRPVAFSGAGGERAAQCCEEYERFGSRRSRIQRRTVGTEYYGQTGARKDCLQGFPMPPHQKPGERNSNERAWQNQLNHGHHTPDIAML